MPDASNPSTGDFTLQGSSTAAETSETLEAQDFEPGSDHPASSFGVSEAELTCFGASD